MRTIYHNGLLDELVTRFGEEAVDRVVAALASERVHVANGHKGKLFNAVGPQIMDWLIEERAGSVIHVPSKRHVQNRRRISAMHMEIQRSDETQIVLAKRYGITVDQVYKIRKKRRDLRIS